MEKGQKLGMVNAMPERQTREGYEDLLDSAILANMNMLRVWGGVDSMKRKCSMKCAMRRVS